MIRTYRVTVDVRAFDDQMTAQTQARLERLIQTFFAALFPLGVATGPDIQQVATDSRWSIATLHAHIEASEQRASSRSAGSTEERE